MTEPTTINVGYIVPNTGDLSGTWGSAALNPNFQALDGFQGGLAAIALSGNLVLSSPAGYTPSPGAGPTQSQNALIRFSGALTANIAVTFPLPGYYIIENLCTGTASHYVQLVSTVGGNKIGAIPGKKCHVFNDGTNMDYVNMPDPGQAYDLHGATTYPAWMSACTVAPYLIKDGSQYATATYPALFSVIGYTFGGSGANFNVPDERARMRMAYDPNNTGRVNSTVNANTMASAGGAQALNSATQLPQQTFTPSGSISGTQTFNGVWAGGGPEGQPGSIQGQQSLTVNFANAVFTGTPITIGNASPSQALPPTIVSFLALIKT